MNYLLKLLPAAAFTLAALPLPAQTIETAYPRVVPDGPILATPAPTPRASEESRYSENEPYLIQSNAAGPMINPEYASRNRSSLTRDEVQARVHVRPEDFRWSAPDTRRLR